MVYDYTVEARSGASDVKDSLAVLEYYDKFQVHFILQPHTKCVICV